MTKRLKAAAAGAHYNPVPVFEYDYDNAIRLAFDDTDSVETDPLEEGVYRLSIDKDAFIQIGENPDADGDTDGTDLVFAPISFWHEYISADQKVSVKAANVGASGVLRMVPVKVVD